ncbi:MAG TPA: galactokinase [Lentisphaeria bacterium]|nr:MAG: galactokinase [Lentisphaerae bacterium GWF2_38_69]HBM15891.1 galactokinase [Lentisphaeria bacterium]
MALAPKTNLKDKFHSLYGVDPDVMAYAPGRIEILGNHTDYNEGLVLSSATDLYTYVAVKECKSNSAKIHSFDMANTEELKLDDSLKVKIPGKWSNYIKGVLLELGRLGKLTPFKAVIYSEVPLSAGMSSSAALEVSSCFAFGKLFGIELDKKEWAKLGQRVENNYMGLKSGLLDQFSSIYGEKDTLILCDFRKIEVIDKVKFPSDYVFVIVNSMIKHNLVESDYNLRRESCERAAASIQKKFPEVMKLRDVTPEMLEECRGTVDFTDYKRAAHVVSEGDLVIKGIEALRKGDIKLFGSYLYASHASSKVNFENSCPELDFLVEVSRSIPGCIGARLSGGGFGGISIHLVKKEMADDYRKRIAVAYKTQTGKEPQTFVCGVGCGAGVY